MWQRVPKNSSSSVITGGCVYQQSSDTSLRWTCVARNEILNSEWQGFPDQEKAIKDADNIAMNKFPTGLFFFERVAIQVHASRKFM
jgi:hypothetical protein